MGGKAVNGWRFWTVEGDEPPATEKPKAEKKSRGGKKKQNKTFFKTPSQLTAPEGKTNYFCSACMKAFSGRRRRGAGSLPRRPPQRRPGAQRPSGVTAAEEAEVTA